MFHKTIIRVIVISGILFYQSVIAQSSEQIIGNIRIQALSENLIRLEQKGSQGFEDRITFTVIDRNWPGEELKIEKGRDHTVVISNKLNIEIPDTARSIAGIVVKSQNSRVGYKFKGLPDLDFMPDPIQIEKIWIMPDSPRLIPPEWGAIPPPDNFKNDPTSGWDTSNNSQDVYIFLIEPGKYNNFRNDFLKLTGSTPMPPLYAFGLWNSRYYPYTEETALETIDTYRKKQVPLDVFVVDTDWRIGASHGYGVNDSLFPDMERFIKRAHEKHVKLMYNDHPEPQAQTALDPKELQYRWDGLTSLFKMGIDIWWYDRNWHTGLLEPMPGISKEVWGMRLYHDITLAYHPNRRPLIMSNVDGIDNGFWNYPSHPASHRFPIWWTGDQQSKWLFLKMGVANGINSGIYRMMPYVNEDLGGHTNGNPEPEQYIRWLHQLH
ncbi:MAG: glycoside hydrolase family 31 protein [Calditrichaceae bacterium]